MFRKIHFTKHLYVLAIFFVLAASCQRKQTIRVDTNYLHEWNEALEKGILNDFFSPPVASRMYAYPNLMAYTILTDGENEMQARLKNFSPITSVEKTQRAIVSLYAFYYVGKKMVYSYHFLDNYLLKFEEQLLKDGYEASDLKKAKALGEKCSQEFLNWVLQDGYKETRSDTKFTLRNKPGSWKPTPPDFMDALEPNWHKIRPFLIDSAAQFTASYQPYPFDMKAGTDFYRELKEVKDQVDQTNKAQLATSKYWDCNPLAPQHHSHASYGEKKLTPGGHWISITRNISKQQKDNLQQAARSYAFVSASVADGFIACWQAKYFYDYIRPVTAIQENWDPKWMTLILTPNFPEYPSGHSVVSGVASTVLAHIYGDTLTFTDNAEEPFGMPPRKFNTLSATCDEAAMSRFWAGIHYKKAIQDGVLMGREIGQYIIKKTETEPHAH